MTSPHCFGLKNIGSNVKKVCFYSPVLQKHLYKAQRSNQRKLTRSLRCGSWKTVTALKRDNYVDLVQCNSSIRRRYKKLENKQMKPTCQTLPLARECNTETLVAYILKNSHQHTPKLWRANRVIIISCWANKPFVQVFILFCWTLFHSPCPLVCWCHGWSELLTHFLPPCTLCNLATVLVSYFHRWSCLICTDLHEKKSA